MQEFFLTHYLFLKSFHIISIIAWMAGMLYLPRLFVYHAKEITVTPTAQTFKIMEKRLMFYIMNPAMIATFIFGGLMLYANPSLFENGWMHIKLTAVFFMAVTHMVFSRWRKMFEADENTRPARFYKIWNEIPTVLMVIIVLAAVMKPF
jgi:protoporphyrinogen IX oxidase